MTKLFLVLYYLRGKLMAKFFQKCKMYPFFLSFTHFWAKQNFPRSSAISRILLINKTNEWFPSNTSFKKRTNR